MVIGRALSNGSSGWCLSVTRILVKVREIHRATVQFGQDRLRWEADEGDSSDVMGKAKKNYYAVAKGLDGPKIYRTWPECQAVVNGFPNAKFKGFATEREAQDFIRDCTGGAPSGTPSGTTAVPRMTHGSGGAGKTRSLPGSKRSPAAAGGDQGVVAGEIAVFTDGACQGNYNVAKSKCPAGWGVVVVEGCSGSPPVGGAEVRRLYGPVCLDKASPAYIGAEVGSNNTGELSAMCEAFRWLSRHEPTSRPAVICYDSEYAANQAQGFHKAHKNIELSSTSKVILMEARLKREIRFLHVKGHSGHQWNDAADAAANLGAAGQTTPSEGIAT